MGDRTPEPRRDRGDECERYQEKDRMHEHQLAMRDRPATDVRERHRHAEDSVCQLQVVAGVDARAEKRALMSRQYPIQQRDGKREA
jgi:hypothetical protein